MERAYTRRQVLATAAGCTVAAVTGSRAESTSRPSPRSGANESIRVGLIGCGSRGPYIGYIFQMMPGVQLAAVCDVHRARAAAAVRQAEQVSGRTPQTYTDFRRLLERRDIDAVIIATDDHWHVLAAIHACAAGKDVYLEKPVGTSIMEGRALVQAARHHDRIVQMGTQQHSWEHYREAVDLIRGGTLGAISQVRVWDVENQSPGIGSPSDEPPPSELDWDFWLGPSPVVPYNRNRYDHEYWFFDYGGGWQVAWGVHHFDIVHWAMGVTAPVAAMAAGGKFAFPGDNREWPDTFAGTSEYPPGPVAGRGFLLTYTCRLGATDIVANRRHGKSFYGTEAILTLDRGGFELVSQEHGGKKRVVERKVQSAKKEHEVVQDHVRGFLDCLRSRRRPAADIETGHQASNPGHLMNIAWRTGRAIRWDAKREVIIGDSAAQAMTTRQYRKPWRLPV